MGTGEGNGRGIYSALEAKTSPIWVHEFVWFGLARGVGTRFWCVGVGVGVGPTKGGQKVWAIILFRHGRGHYCGQQRGEDVELVISR